MAKVLIVEDNKALNRAYTLILNKEGHKVKTAFNGKEGLEKAESFKPSVILLDILMPVMDGITFLKKYDLKNTPDTVVVLLSNVGDEKLIKQAMKLGAYKYILKAQASPAELSQLVNRLIKHNIEKSKNN